MNKIELKERIIYALSHSTADEDYHNGILSEPFIQHGKLCACDGHKVLRINQTVMSDLDYKKLEHPDTDVAIPKELDLNMELTFKKVEAVYKKIPKTDMVRCLDWRATCGEFCEKYLTKEHSRELYDYMHSHKLIDF